MKRIVRTVSTCTSGERIKKLHLQKYSAEASIMPTCEKCFRQNIAFLSMHARERAKIKLHSVCPNCVQLSMTCRQSPSFWHNIYTRTVGILYPTYFLAKCRHGKSPNSGRHVKYGLVHYTALCVQCTCTTHDGNLFPQFNSHT